MSNMTRNLLVRWLRNMGVSDENLHDYDDETLRVIADTVMLEHRLGLSY